MSYCFNNKSSCVSQRSNPSSLGEYELHSMLTSDEKSQLNDSTLITELIADPIFIARVFELSSITIGLSGYKTEMAIPNFYFAYKPDVEFFASSSNHYASNWGSNNPSDLELDGCMGNFLGIASSPQNEILEDTTLCVAFPPSYDPLIEMAFSRCIDLFLAMRAKRGITADDEKNESKLPFTIVFVYFNSGNAVRIVNRILSASKVDPLESEAFNITEGYDPYTGTEYTGLSLEAIALKTRNSDLVFAEL
jgi:hypothetical protein